MELVPLSLACISNDIDLKFPLKTVSDDGSNKHVPHIEGCIMIQHKSVVFAIHLYPCPNDKSATVIEFQRRSGDMSAFQKFYDKSLEELGKNMKDLRNCNRTPTFNDWNCLPMDDLPFDDLQLETCSWDKDSLDLLASLIEDESYEAIKMLGSLCDEMEKYVSLRKQVLQHKKLMNQLATHVLTHQDPCFIRLGLVALDISLRGEKMELVKNVLRSNQILAYIIGLLNCECAFVLRHTVRLLSLLESQCGCPWKLNQAQKRVLINCMPTVQHHLLEAHTWSSTYATEGFITKDMFQRIGQHIKV